MLEGVTADQEVVRSTLNLRETAGFANELSAEASMRILVSHPFADAPFPHGGRREVHAINAASQCVDRQRVEPPKYVAWPSDLQAEPPPKPRGVVTKFAGEAFL